jgi:curved DNA-binding protein CbpA
MFKDPLHKEETPYDILGLPVNAGPEEVHQALAKFIRQRRENVRRLQVGQQAQQLLKNPRLRLAVDILYYQADGLHALAGTEPPPLALEEFKRVPYLSPEELFSDLDREDFAADVTEIPPRDFAFPVEDGFDRLAAYPLDVTLDR